MSTSFTLIGHLEGNNGLCTQGGGHFGSSYRALEGFGPCFFPDDKSNSQMDSGFSGPRRLSAQAPHNRMENQMH